MTFTFKPLTVETWHAFESLFGENGACGGCWCMTWRVSRREFNANKGEGNRQSFRVLVESGEVPGILAFDGDRVAGWCALAPRASYPALERSRVMRPIDEQPVWSISCFFIDRPYRRRGLSAALLSEAIHHVETMGGTIVEGYPVEPRNKSMAPVFAWTGIASAFRRAGFTECARHSETRPVMRFYIKRIQGPSRRDE